MFSLIPIGFSQVFNNPYWILADNPPKEVSNFLPPSTISLPFTLPLPQGTAPYSNTIDYNAGRYRSGTSAVFNDCGDPIFYIAGDWVFNASGIEAGYLIKKDHFVKSGLHTGSPEINQTDNFEQVIAEVPGSSGEYFIFSVDYRDFSGTDLYAQIYNSVSNTLGQPQLVYTFSGVPNLRLALSNINQNGDRTLYCFNGVQLREIGIPSNAQSISDLTINFFLYSSPHDFVPLTLCSEMELSHDGTKLAVASFSIQNGNSVLINIIDLQTHQMTAYDPCSDCIKYIGGLEFLPTGELGVTIEWSSSLLQSFNGVGYFNQTFTGYNVINGTSSFKKGMLEMGISNQYYWSLFANNGTGLAEIGFSGSNPPLLNSIFSVSSSGYASLLNPVVSVSGGLPDQVDGQGYNWADCSGSYLPSSSETVDLSGLTYDLILEPILYR